MKEFITWLAILALCATAQAAILYRGPSGAISSNGPIGPDGQKAGWPDVDSGKLVNEKTNEIPTGNDEGVASGNVTPTVKKTIDNGLWRGEGVIIKKWKGDDGSYRGKVKWNGGKWARDERRKNWSLSDENFTSEEVSVESNESLVSNESLPSNETSEESDGISSEELLKTRRVVVKRRQQ
ncbi:hypothetical protein ABEB36_004006 [Hypothenemus hampei]|uniref:Uncharacterized protein n=1 Tax=Hypothenemus hampei TaxID=57062 RepID=A0ABD1F5M5_HYPHA